MSDKGIGEAAKACGHADPDTRDSRRERFHPGAMLEVRTAKSEHGLSKSQHECEYEGVFA